VKGSAILLIPTLIMTACTHIEPNPVQEYLALAWLEPDIQTYKRTQAFINLYNQLKEVSVDEQISRTYAEKFFFSDTVVTIHNRQSLLRYLKQTQHNVDSIKFKALDVVENGKDSYVRWLMQTRFKIMGQSLDIESIGMSHLRFNEDDKIILHQDYWDSMQGFYQHIPIIGGLLRWIKSDLGNY
jgi:hypothetical protein